MKQATAWCMLVIGVTSSGLQAGQTVTYEKITIPGAFHSFTATDLSADGSIIVGYAVFPTGGAKAYLFESGQFSELSGMTSAMSISDDGSVIAGDIRHVDPESSEAAIWIDGNITPLGTAGLGQSWASMVSGDGNVVVMGWTPDFFVWENGWLTSLTETFGFVGGISFDGSVIVGQSPEGSLNRQPVIWTNGAVDQLELLQGHLRGSANDVSSDGSVVVGQSVDSEWIAKAVLWVNGSPMELQGIPDLDHASAWQVSGDGSVILGSAGDDLFLLSEAVLWFKETGYVPVTLASIFDEAGIEQDVLNGSEYWTGGNLSEDGNTILFGNLRVNLAAPAWVDYPVANRAMDVNTEGFMGWINVFHGDFVWSYALDGWMYCPEENVDESGAWVFVPRVAP